MGKFSVDEEKWETCAGCTLPVHPDIGLGIRWDWGRPFCSFLCEMKWGKANGKYEGRDKVRFSFIRNMRRK